MHPQLLADLLGTPFPPQPGESGAPFEPQRLPLVEPRTGNQAAKCSHLHASRSFNRPGFMGCPECGHVWREATFFGVDTVVDECARCGEIDEHGALEALRASGRRFVIARGQTAELMDRIRHGALIAVAGRMFQGTGR